jgi:hypothetical protein
MTEEEEAQLTTSERADRTMESDNPALSQTVIASFKIDVNRMKATIVKTKVVNPFTHASRRATQMILHRGTEKESDSSMFDPLNLHQHSFVNMHSIE